MTECLRFQHVAWEWMRSGEITRTSHMLSPLEELAGFNYGFIYLLEIIGGSLEIGGPMGFAHGVCGGPQCVYKLGYSEHPMRRIRELQPAYKGRLKLRACFVGDPPAERFAHRRFKSLRVKNELFLAHPIIDEYFSSSREQMRSQLREIHVCSQACPQFNARLDLAMLSAWLAR
jgi:Meiotically Up-regulated Gene 113 (MUG113) protein